MNKINYYKKLLLKIKNNSATIAIVGLGYVGSELIKKFDKKGFKTIGIDTDKNKLKLKKNKNMILTNNYKFINKSDIIIIALPTPLTKNLKPDLSYIKKSLINLKKYMKKGQLLSLESTTYPGTTEEILAKYIQKNNFKLSNDYFLVYSPERISPELKVKNQTIKFKLHNTPKVCGGYSNKCKKLGLAIYKKITNRVVLASNLKTAETSKMIENVFRSKNIALVNELKMFLNKINVDINEALSLADTKPFGFTKFDPGPGYGGHCIPIDPIYLYWIAKKNNFDLNFIKTSSLVNKKVTYWIVNKVIKFIKKNDIKLFNNKILILGVTYKKDIDDTRESPAFKIANKLNKMGYDFDYSDPYIKTIKFKNKLKKSKKITSKILNKYKIVLIVTDHSKFDYNLIAKKAHYIFDSRNSIKNRTKNCFKV